MIAAAVSLVDFWEHRRGHCETPGQTICTSEGNIVVATSLLHQKYWWTFCIGEADKFTSFFLSVLLTRNKFETPMTTRVPWRAEVVVPARGCVTNVCVPL